MAVRFTKDGLYGHWYGTNAEKATFTGMKVGDKFTETDTGDKFEYSGSAWVADKLSVTVNASDIEIGAVELKNGSTDDRAFISPTGSLSVSVTSNSMELFGATVATRPLATAVAVGTTFTTVTNPLVIYMSDGTDWIEVS